MQTRILRIAMWWMWFKFLGLPAMQRFHAEFHQYFCWIFFTGSDHFLQRTVYNFIACGCNAMGSKSSECDQKTGECPCHANFTGKKCDRCAPGYYDYPNCKPCSCLASGSKGMTCDSSGQVRLRSYCLMTDGLARCKYPLFISNNHIGCYRLQAIWYLS